MGVKFWLDYRGWFEEVGIKVEFWVRFEVYVLVGNLSIGLVVCIMEGSVGVIYGDEFIFGYDLVCMIFVFVNIILGWFVYEFIVSGIVFEFIGKIVVWWVGLCMFMWLCFDIIVKVLVFGWLIVFIVIEIVFEMVFVYEIDLLFVV